MKLKGLKKSVGEYQRYNEGGYFSPEYGILMYDKATGQLWTDYFYSIGHNTWNEYNSSSVVNLSRMLSRYEIDITMKNVKKFIDENFGGCK